MCVCMGQLTIYRVDRRRKRDFMQFRYGTHTLIHTHKNIHIHLVDTQTRTHFVCVCVCVYVCLCIQNRQSGIRQFLWTYNHIKKESPTSIDFTVTQLKYKVLRTPPSQQGLSQIHNTVPDQTSKLDAKTKKNIKFLQKGKYMMY